jgi:hypothetical protein
MDREQRRRQVSAQAGAQVQGGTGGSPDVNFSLRIAKHTKEPQTLDMIHVQVSEQNIYMQQ